MPETFRRQVTVTADSTTYTNVLEVTGNSHEATSPSVAAAKSGSLTTRTDDDTGVVTFATGHGFATNNVIDLFWSGGQRRALTATVAGDDVTLDGGSGDVLPAVNTAVTGMVPTEIPFVVDGNTVVGLALSCSVPGYGVFVDDADAEINTAIYELDNNQAGSWIEGDGTNPLANTITSVVKLSHGSTSAKTMNVVAVFGAP